MSAKENESFPWLQLIFWPDDHFSVLSYKSPGALQLDAHTALLTGKAEGLFYELLMLSCLSVFRTVTWYVVSEIQAVWKEVLTAPASRCADFQVHNLAPKGQSMLSEKLQVIWKTPLGELVFVFWIGGVWSRQTWLISAVCQQKKLLLFQLLAFVVFFKQVF